MRGVYVQKNSPYYWIRLYNKFEEDPKKRRKSYNTKIPVTPADRKRAEEAHKRGERAKLVGTPELRKLVREFQQGYAEWALQKNAKFNLKKEKKLSEGYEEFKIDRTVPGKKKSLKPKTLQTYSLAVKHFIDCCKDKDIYLYKESDYAQLLYYFEERNLSINARSIYTRALKSLWNYFVGKKYTMQNIIEPVEPEEKDPAPIPLEEMWSIIKYLKDGRYPHHWQIVYFMLLTGCRPSSAIVQRKEDINFRRKIIKIRNVKTGARKGKEYYIFPLFWELERFLKEDMNVKQGESGRLFEQFAVIPENYTWPMSFWKRAMKILHSAKVVSEKWTLKQIRPTTASYLINVLELDIFDVKKLLDHTDIKITDKHYIRYEVKRIREKLDEFDFNDLIDGRKL